MENITQEELKKVADLVAVLEDEHALTIADVLNEMCKKQHEQLHNAEQEKEK